jgi:hypothetical protein
MLCGLRDFHSSHDCLVMAGLVPAIHVFLHEVPKEDVDARHKAGRDAPVRSARNLRRGRITVFTCQTARRIEPFAQFSSCLPHEGVPTKIAGHSSAARMVSHRQFSWVPGAGTSGCCVVHAPSICFIVSSRHSTQHLSVARPAAAAFLPSARPDEGWAERRDGAFNDRACEARLNHAYEACVAPIQTGALASRRSTWRFR